MITMKENMCGSVNTRCLQSIAYKCSVYQTNFNFFDQTKIMSTSCSRHAQFLHDQILLSSSRQTGMVRQIYLLFISHQGCQAFDGKFVQSVKMVCSTVVIKKVKSLSQEKRGLIVFGCKHRSPQTTPISEFRALLGSLLSEVIEFER